SLRPPGRTEPRIDERLFVQCRHDQRQGRCQHRQGEGTQVERRTFSVNGGMCPNCEGMGTATDIDLGEVIDESRSLNDGAITITGYNPGAWSVRMSSESAFFDPHKPLADYSETEPHHLLHAGGEKIRIKGTNFTFD